jgi:hypothetical protein
VAQPCKICPIALPSNRAMRMHHQSLGLNSLVFFLAVEAEKLIIRSSSALRKAVTAIEAGA